MPNAKFNLSFLQSNVRKSKDCLTLVLNLCHHKKVDILLLQELPYKFNKISGIPPHLRGSTFHSITTTNNLVHSAIILLNQNLHPHIIPTLTSEFMTSLEIKTSNHTLNLTSCYLHPTDNIDQEIHRLDIHASTTPQPSWILAMDSNGHSPLWTSKQSDKRGAILEKLFTSKALTLLNTYDAITWSSRGSLSSIDLTLISLPISNLKWIWEVLPDDITSDHFPILFSTNQIFTVPPLNNKIKFRNSSSECPKFSKSLNSKFETLEAAHSPTCHQTLNSLIKETQNTIFSTAKNIIGLQTPPSSPRPPCPWWNTDLTLLKKHCNKLRHHCQHALSTHLKKEFSSLLNASRKLLKEKMHHLQEESWKEFCTSSSSDTPWNKVTKFIKGPTPPTIDLSLCIPNSSFSTQKPPPDPTSNILNHFFPKERKPDFFDLSLKYSYPLNLNNPNDPPFTSFELQSALSKTKKKSAAGPDNLDGHLTIKAISTNPEFFLKIYNECLRLECFPSPWKIGQVFTIAKSSSISLSSTVSPNNFRPITLLDIMGKIYERLLLTRLTWKSETKNWLHRNQHGFRPGRSTDSALLQIKSTITNSLSNKNDVLLISLDISSAFDSAWWQAILQALRKHDCPPNLYNILKNFLSDRHATLTIGNKSYSRTLEKGCPQGSVLSPFLWNIGFDEVFHCPLPTNCTLIGYADDLFLIVSGPTTDLHQQANTALATILTWCHQHHLSINPSKTTSCIFSKHRNPPSISLQIGSSIIQSGDIIKILGIWFDKHLKFNFHVHKKITQVKSIYFRLTSTMNNQFGPSTKNLHYLYKGLIEPILTYGSTTWWTKRLTKKSKDSLASIQRLFALRTTRAYHTTSFPAALALAKFMPIDMVLDLRTELSFARLHQYSSRWSSNIQHKINQSNLPFPPDRHPPSEIPFTEAKGFLIYVDGSHQPNYSGCGICVLHSHNSTTPIIRASFKLPQQPDPSQTEACALLLGLDIGTKFLPTNSSFTIMSDCQGLLHQLACYTPKSDLICQFLCKFAKFKNSHNITISWVPGHSNIRGNEIAHSLASNYSNFTNHLNINLTPSFDSLKVSVKSSSLQLWSSSYASSTKGSGLKFFFPTLQNILDSKITNCLSSLSTSILTGHGKFYHHSLRLGLPTISECPSCHNPDFSIPHQILHCNKFNKQRNLLSKDLKAPVTAFNLINSQDTWNLFIHHFGDMIS